ncbi:conserved hypothetical protein [Ricinus communis]|uniref:Uncharacterized protein n=1 Tax=Ricinus communis TaxID=3988 RepID=B9RKU9_RICCO|nr:conserved hypothetical protein [Ricinus communis]|eukprot:XP_002514343.1 uncharacterized protein LOC8284834 [Ricinus communis]
MAITTSCCLNMNIPPPTSASSLPSSSSTTKPTAQASWFKNEKWRSQCVLGMACMIIGLEMDNLVNEETNLAMAAENSSSVVELKVKPKTRRWSDKRMCPPWRLNSLETIVPENLPRPSARRRWEATGYSKIDPAPAPARKVSVKSIMIMDNCFTM